ncbi:hypothetical protein [Ruminococcus sp.]|uniref:hypothetical protein n=1 Tax=Ruminococcus sp. TaxID=41978 RepID=UPI003EFE8CD1
MIIACIISFIIGALVMMCAIGLVACQKDKKPRNKVRFFVTLNFDGKPWLHIKDIEGKYYPIIDADNLNQFGIDVFEFVDMPFEEVREVFLNLED